MASMESPNFTLIPNVDTSTCTAISLLLATLVPCFPHKSPVRRGLLLLQITFTIQFYFAPPPPGIKNIAVHYTSSIFHANLTARFFDRLYLRIPEKDFYRKGADGPEDPNSLGFLQKLLWSFELFTVTRGIGWNWRLAGIPKSKQRSRWEFVRQSLMQWVTMYCGVYLTGIIGRNILDNWSTVEKSQLREALVAISCNPVGYVVFVILGSAVTVYSHFGIIMLPVSIACVGLHIGPEAWHDPAAWPPNFGSIKEAFSIRRFWGLFWHQQTRRITSFPGPLILSKTPEAFRTSKSRLPRITRRYLLVYISFLTSGLIHAAGSLTATRVASLPMTEGGEMMFFFLQATAMMLEDFVCWIIGVDDRVNSPPSRTRRTIGYIITLAWWTLSRVALKGIPMALAQGMDTSKGKLAAVVDVVATGAEVVPGNFVRAIVEGVKI